jgi:hypothetical protein
MADRKPRKRREGQGEDSDLPLPASSHLLKFPEPPKLIPLAGLFDPT